ncbi:hypothetical protein B0O41_3444 [Propionibacteriaceae bacterium ES.041]|uniref:hypothetical protein n=1 Tax=Enemella evansiae TaxID=2016499 RepID=UPI000B96C308|nr:hypothetical protein [Enemella evansiae]OYN94102.1 hypothetical protein CGZ96_19780 [Enemella evansiae]PFG68601.1 hypothetical protein B0O41_3444 [Propionibacteriaceae bacterium ES.041]
MTERSPFARPEPDEPEPRPSRSAGPAPEPPTEPPTEPPSTGEPLWQPDPTAGRARRRRPGLWAAVGVLALALLIGTAFGVRTLLAPAASTSQAGPADQATAYLQALAAGDADRALALSFVKGSGPLVSKDHLQQNRPQISDITVIDAGSGDPAGTDVVLGYKLAGKDVRGTFPMFQNPQRQWQLRRGSVQLRVAPTPQMVPVLLDGRKLESNSYSYLVDVFPGTHTLSTGSKWLDFTTPQVTVTGLTDPPAVDAATAPTAAYTGAAKQQVSERIKGCVASSELAPAGCPWARKARADQPVRPGSVSYQLLSQQISVGKPGSTDAIARGEVQLRLRMSSSSRINGSYQSDTEEFDVRSRYAMDLLSAGPDFVWE